MKESMKEYPILWVWGLAIGILAITTTLGITPPIVKASRNELPPGVTTISVGEEGHYVIDERFGQCFFTNIRGVVRIDCRPLLDKHE